MLALLAALAGCQPAALPSGATWPDHRYQHALSRPSTALGASPILGSHAILAEEQGFGHSPASTPAIDTLRHGSWFLLFRGGHAANAAMPTDNYGNVWTALGVPVVYQGYQGAYDVQGWLARDGRGGPGHVASLAKGSAPEGELTMALVELRHASRLVDMVQTYAPAGTTVQSGEVTTAGPALLVAFWWGDGFVFDNHAEPDEGFEVFEQVLALPPASAVQCAVAFRQVDRGGRWRVSWRQSPRQGAVLWLLAFARDAQGAAVVSPQVPRHMLLVDAGTPCQAGGWPRDGGACGPRAGHDPPRAEHHPTLSFQRRIYP